MFLIDVEMSFECCEILRIRPHPDSQLWLRVFNNYQYESPAFFLHKTTVLDVCSIYIFLIYNNRIIFKGSLHSGYLLKGQCQEISSIIVHVGLLYISGCFFFWKSGLGVFFLYGQNRHEPSLFFSLLGSWSRS